MPWGTMESFEFVNLGCLFAVVCTVGCLRCLFSEKAEDCPAGWHGAGHRVVGVDGGGLSLMPRGV